MIDRSVYIIRVWPPHPRQDHRFTFSRHSRPTHSCRATLGETPFGVSTDTPKQATLADVTSEPNTGIRTQVVASDLVQKVTWCQQRVAARSGAGVGLLGRSQWEKWAGPVAGSCVSPH